MHGKTHFGMLLVILSLLFPVSVFTETLAIPETSATSESITLPGRGMQMEDVRAQFGEPQETLPSIGSPPITRWIYKEFSVIFEGNYVIHSIASLRNNP